MAAVLPLAKHWLQATAVVADVLALAALVLLALVVATGTGTLHGVASVAGLVFLAGNLAVLAAPGAHAKDDVAGLAGLGFLHAVAVVVVVAGQGSLVLALAALWSVTLTATAR